MHGRSPMSRDSVDNKNQLHPGYAFPDVTWKKKKKKIRQNLKCGVHLAKGGLRSVADGAP